MSGWYVAALIAIASLVFLACLGIAIGTAMSAREASDLDHADQVRAARRARDADLLARQQAAAAQFDHFGRNPQ